jgi:hypothetical protein
MQKIDLKIHVDSMLNATSFAILELNIYTLNKYDN